MLENKAGLHGGLPSDRPVGADEPGRSASGVKDGPKPLNVREWECGQCGAVHDRDVNAAKNIIALGRGRG